MRKAMELMVTGDSITGVEAVALGWANSAYPAEELDERVLAIAQRIAKLPPDIVQLNKRAVHRGMEIMGLRTAIRAGTEICSLGLHQKSTRNFLSLLKTDGVTSALDSRDGEFGDYRTSQQNQATEKGLDLEHSERTVK
jgi:enoyl-CoA hydratase